MLRKFTVPIVALLLLVACAAPAANSPAPAAAPAATTSASATGEAAPAAATQPATAPSTSEPAAAPTESQSPPVPATSAPTAAPAISSAAGPTRLVIKPDASEARYEAREVLAGRTLPSDAIGKTKAVSGAIVIQPDGKLVPSESKIVVDISSLTSDQPMRDGFIKRATLDTANYPDVTFVPTSVEGLPSPLPTSGDVNFTLKGDLTVKGKAFPSTWQVTGHINGDQMTGSASTSFKFEDFGLSMPKVGRVLSIEDNVKLVLDYTVAKSS